MFLRVIYGHLSRLVYTYKCQNLASRPLRKRKSSRCNHRLNSMLKYLLLSSAGMKTCDPVSLCTHIHTHTHIRLFPDFSIRRNSLYIYCQPMSACEIYHYISCFLPEGVLLHSIKKKELQRGGSEERMHTMYYFKH